MNIRKGTVEDLELLIKLAYEFNKFMDKCILPEFKLSARKYDKKFEEDAKNYITKYLNNDNSICYILEENTAIGCIYGRIEEQGARDKYKVGIIESFIVTESKRGKGFGKKLYLELVNWFKLEECKFVELSVVSTNPAKEVYKSWGLNSFLETMRKKL